MMCMKATPLAQQALPLPNPGDWMTGARAAELLGVDRCTISRMVADGILRAYLPQCTPNKTQRFNLFWAAEVEELRQARIRVGRQTVNIH